MGNNNKQTQNNANAANVSTAAIPAPVNLHDGVNLAGTNPAQVTLNNPVATTTTEQAPAASNSKIATTADELRDPITVKSTAQVVLPTSEIMAMAMAVVKMQTQSALYQIIDYAKKMKPGQPRSALEIQTAQLGLLNNLFIILSAEDEHFHVAYGALLSIVRDNQDGAFRAISRNRGLGTMSMEVMDNKQMRFLTRMLDMIVLTATTVNLSDVPRHMDIKKAVETAYNERIKKNLTNYYSV